MLRNEEFRLFALLFLALSVAGLMAGFAISLAAGTLTAILSATFWIAVFIFTKKRYQNLARLSERIDHVLHGEDYMEFNNFVEGELSILHSEIMKMTLRIREQNAVLIKDRQYLADSLADIAHQLRTPLTSASLALSLAAKTADENEQQSFIREVEGLLVQTDWLITSLLKLSRLDAGVAEFKNEPVYVKDLVKSALRPLLIPLELKNIETRTDVPENAVIWCDINWLSEAARNILKNCMENAGERGEIKIICNDTALYTEIIIRDNGAGFAKDDLLHLFDRFYRGKSQNAAGYGIGLALAKTIISRQDGTITAKNHPKGGAVFTMRFSK